LTPLKSPVIWQTLTGELQFQTLAEHQLLLALLQFPQSLSPNKIMYGYSQTAVPGHQTWVEWPSPESYLRRQAQQWSNVFLNFYRQCRIFGDVQQVTPGANFYLEKSIGIYFGNSFAG
jgi:hypothetical protein